MLQGIKSWESKEEVTSYKMNMNNSILMQNITEISTEVDLMKFDNKGIRIVLYGEGIYEGFDLTQNGINITLTAGTAIVNGLVMFIEEEIKTLTDNEINYIYINEDSGVKQSTLPDNIGNNDQELYEIEVSGGSIINIVDKRKQLLTLEELFNQFQAEKNKKQLLTNTETETITAESETTVNITHIDGICGEPVISIDNVNINYEILNKTDNSFDLRLININTVDETVNYTWERKVIEM